MATTPQDQNGRRRAPVGRGRGGGIRPISLTGGDTVPQASTLPIGGISGTQENFPIELAIAESQGPWKRDRITLTLEAQVILMEMKSAARNLLDFAEQIYSNMVSQVKVAAGRMLRLEPFGGYRVFWKN